MARTRVVPTEGLLSDLEYTSAIVSYSNGIDSTGALYWAGERRRKERFKGFGKARNCISRWRQL